MEITNETVCLITGASSGIGRALAIELAGRGARLALAARREELLRGTAEEVERRGGSALSIRCDVTRRADLERAVEETIERFGRLDVLVNNAGRGHFAYIEDTPDEQIESIFRVNVFSLWYGTAPAVRQMRRQGSGHVINIASLAGKVGYPANGAYVAAKHATIGFTRALRGAEIARERGVEPPEIPLLSAEEVAEAIARVIIDPVPELYTHPGARALALAFEENQRAMEERLEPLWLANREGYERKG
jgi:NAD(P)-dependent dehydrogenase (short-subunit alcohol dehydrogenase family)